MTLPHEQLLSRAQSFVEKRFSARRKHYGRTIIEAMPDEIAREMANFVMAEIALMMLEAESRPLPVAANDPN